MTSVRNLVVGLALAGLTACAKPIVQDRPVRVSVPVATPCATTRPAPVPTLQSTYPGWDDMDVRQKAAAVGKHAVDLRNYGDQLNASTGACK